MLTAALLALAVGVPASQSQAQPGRVASPAAVDLPALQAELAMITARATALAASLERAAARDGGLRIAMEDLQEQEDAARERFGDRVREVYMQSGPTQLDALKALRPETSYLSARAGVASIGVEQSLVDALSDESVAAKALRARSERFRDQLRSQAVAVLAAQDRARDLLTRAEAAAAEQASRAALAAARAQLDAISQTVTIALTPAQTERSRRAAQDQEPVLALIEAAGSGYPAGYVPTGQLLSGQASWYGPGFVGSPTASGAPYDPERLTCAHKELPLGTVIRVSHAGRAVSCLVTDRGPYVGGRILDMSRAGSRALGYDGVADVTIEVLDAAG